jgi:hypothetical protein
MSETIERGIGDNRGPEPTLKERLEEKHAELFGLIDALDERANALKEKLPHGKLGKVLVATDDDLGKLSDVVVEARKLTKRLEDQRKAEKEPFLLGGKVVDATFTEGRKDRIDAISDALTLAASAYNRAKADRAREAQRAEEARMRKLEQEAREAAAIAADFGEPELVADHNEVAHKASVAAHAVAAPVKAADVTRVYSAGGTTATTRTTVKARILDVDKIDLNKLRAWFEDDHIQGALNKYVKTHKKTRPLEGVEFYDEETASFRS